MSGAGKIERRRGGEKDIANSIRKSLQLKTPLSLIRLGDGESSLLGFPNYSSRESRDHFLRLWWGTDNIDPEMLARLRADLADACRSADLLGTPRSDHPDPLYSKVDGIVGAEGLFGLNTIFVSSLVHLWLYRSGLLAAIMAEQKSIFVVSPHDNLHERLSRITDASVTHVKISGEHKFFKSSQHFPAEYESTRGQMKCEEGSLCLIAAGVCGKVYANDLKNSGGVALDVGSVLDYICGIRTRSAHFQFDGEGRSVD